MDINNNAVSIFNKLAHHYQQKFMNVDLYADTLDLFTQYLPKKNPAILEVACGPGNITKYLLDKRPDLQITGTDLAPSMIELAKINNPTAQFQLLDCRNILTLKKMFEGIMCGFCLPYLSGEETIQLIKNASNVLNSKGLFYISTMEDDYKKSAFKKGSTGDLIFMHYYTEHFLTEQLLLSNFKIINISRKITKAEDGLDVIDLIIIAQINT